MSNATRDQVFGYMVSKGVPPAVAAGITGNLAVESMNFSQSVVSGKRTGDNGTAKYSGQWRGDRLANFEAFAREKGKNPADIFTQVDFIAEEMNKQSKYADPQAVKHANAILSAPNAKRASDLFSQHYERPNINYAHNSQRATIAEKAYEAYRSGTIAPSNFNEVALPAVAPAPTPALAPTAYASPLGPIGDRVTSGFGQRSAPSTVGGKKGSSNHEGLDLAATGPTAGGRGGYPAMSVAPGVVSYAGWAGNYGNMVEITHEDGMKSRYAHLDKIAPGMKEEAKVAQGIPVGTVGTTGNSSAPHLHFEMIDQLGKKVNPASMISFQQNRAVPTPTAAPRSAPMVAGNLPGAPARSVATTSLPGQPTGMPAVSDFGLNMGPAGKLGGVPAHSVQTASISPATQVASAPSARSAQEASMAALSRDYADSRVAAAHGPAPATSMSVTPSQIAASVTGSQMAQAPAAHAGPSARSAQDVSMAALATNTAPSGKTAAHAGPSARSAQEMSMAAFAPAVGPAAHAYAAEDKVVNDPWGAVMSNVPAQPVVAPPAVAVQAPVTAMVAPARNAPAADRATSFAPSASAYDFHAGRVDSAISNSGSHLSRDNLGNTYTYTPSFDVTTITNPAGDIVGTRDGKVSSLGSGNSSFGSLGALGNPFSSTGVFSGPGLQNAAVGVAGSAVGGVLGGFLGPIGSMVGSALGKNLAQQHFGTPAPSPMPFGLTPAEIALAAQSVVGGLAFPDAPTGGQGWGGWTEGNGPGSRDHAMGISPGATAAIDSGRGGLY